MNEYTYVVSRANIYSSRVEFDNIRDAVAYILGSEQLNPGYSVSYNIDKIKKTVEKETDDD